MSDATSRPDSMLPNRTRSGVTLLEILIAVFILTVGLLGVAMVIPAGRVQMLEAGKADRSAACAQAILREVKIREFLNPRMWRYPNRTATGASIVVATNRIPARTYAIDPLFIAFNEHPDPTAASTLLPQFPYLYRPANNTVTYGGWDMARVTVFMPSLNRLMPLSTAQRLCTWHDDLIFPIPTEPEDRPRQTEWVDVDPSNADDAIAPIPWPIRNTDEAKPDASDPARPLYSENFGEFSWMLTVTPVGEILMEDHDGNPGNEPYVNIDDAISYVVSVVIFYRRDLKCPNDRDSAGDKPTERMIAQITFPGGGWNGGDALLHDEKGKRDYLDLKENDWLMVPIAARTEVATPFDWYRVVGVDEEPLLAGTDVWERNITLEGRDWRFDYNNAALFSDVINVFTTTIEPEGR